MSDPNACKPCNSDRHDACVSPRMCLCDHMRGGGEVSERCSRAVGLPCPTHGLSHWRGPKDAHYYRLLKESAS